MATDNTTAPNVVNLFTKTPYEPLTPSTTTPATPATPEKSGRDTKHAVPTDLLPTHPPTTEEIYSQRWARGGISKARAAELCGVDKRTWRRWESGETYMPRAVWAWFRAATGGGFAAAGPEWDGWVFYRGELCAPEGTGFSVGEVRALPYTYALRHELSRNIQNLEEERAWLQQEVRMLHAKRDHTLALGQIKAIIYVMMQLMIEYRESEDKLIQEIAEDMWNLGVKTCEIEAKLIMAGLPPPDGGPAPNESRSEGTVAAA